jgi:hypothetical protein
MENNIFKNPSSLDLEFIEELITKYKIEDQFLTYLSEEDKELIKNASSAREKVAIKSLFQEFFPYTQKLWEEVFLVINNKIPLNLVAQDFEKRSGLPIDICNAIAQDIANNSTIQKEITAIQIEEDIPAYDDYEDFPESQEDLRELKDEEDVAKIEKEIDNGGTTPTEKGAGLGQELF